jgi:hypothetical protein
MTNDEVLEVVELTMRRILEMRKVKARDYSPDEDDAFSGVRRVAVKMKLSVMRLLMVYLSKHLDAIETCVWRHDAKLELIESVDGRIDDVILYLCLLKAAIVEERGRGG